MGALETAIKELNKKLGASFITIGGMATECKRHTTGIDALDIAMGGGIPERRIVMIAGKYSSGKSTTAITAAANIQKNGGKVAWVDTEGAFDASWAKKFGVNTEELIFCRPSTIEETSDIIESLICTGELDLIVFDSVAVTPSHKELEDSAEQKSMGGAAKAIGLFMRKITARLNNPKQQIRTSIILINQLRDNIGGYGPMVYTPGGRQLHYQSDLIIHLTPSSEPVGGKETPVGVNVNFKVIKNRTAPPLQIGSYDLMFKGWINNKKSIVEGAVKHGYITKSGAWFILEGNPKKFHGLDNVIEAVTDAQLAEFKAKLTEKAKECNFDVVANEDMPEEV